MLCAPALFRVCHSEPVLTLAWESVSARKRETDCHNQSADWFRNDSAGVFRWLLTSILLLHGLDGLDDAAGAQTVGAQCDEILGVVQVGDAAGGLDLHMGGDMLFE